ncbi:hypothetical protein ABZV34_10460 [Streptomyces sp. NPDC005195]|uniref:hypothetical protein n=1 Tax=Streptomyces sp. NPDC005195 TaxID=3154561 RepID=UPI0033B9A5D0
MTARYSRPVHVNGDSDGTVAAVRAAPGEQDFGVLTEIDVQATLKAGLGHEWGTA